MAGAGTGYPNFFLCPVLRRRYYKWRTSSDYEYHRVQRTGRTKKAPGHGKGHARKLDLSYEYVCRCGHRGWTCAADILRIAPLMDPPEVEVEESRRG